MIRHSVSSMRRRFTCLRKDYWSCLHLANFPELYTNKIIRKYDIVNFDYHNLSCGISASDIFSGYCLDILVCYYMRLYLPNLLLQLGNCGQWTLCLALCTIAKDKNFFFAHTTRMVMVYKNIHILICYKLFWNLFSQACNILHT